MWLYRSFSLGHRQLLQLLQHLLLLRLDALHLSGVQLLNLLDSQSETQAVTGTRPNAALSVLVNPLGSSKKTGQPQHQPHHSPAGADRPVRHAAWGNRCGVAVHAPQCHALAVQTYCHHVQPLLRRLVHSRRPYRMVASHTVWHRVPTPPSPAVARPCPCHPLRCGMETTLHSHPVALWTRVCSAPRQ